MGVGYGYRTLRCAAAENEETDVKPPTRLHRGVLALMVCTTAMLGAEQARADWREPVGGPSPINASASRNASSPSLTTVGATPHVAWLEDTTEPGQGNSNAIHAARLSPDGTAWTRLAPGSPITRRATASTSGPGLADVDGLPWVTWAENSDTGRDMHVARLAPSGAEWIPMDDSDHPINHDPNGRASDLGRPSIAASGSRPYVAFWERDPGTGSLFPGPPMAPGKIWVMRLSADGTSWEEVGGGPVNIDPERDALVPALAMIDGRPWVSYIQVAVPDNAPPSFQIRVARLSDTGKADAGRRAAGRDGPTQPQESLIRRWTVWRRSPSRTRIGSMSSVLRQRATASGSAWATGRPHPRVRARRRRA